ncbi:MAG: transketolase [Deltaproteobacteria bacterium]|nr:transketolase [Deltaproteobacteria bacterium]
MNSLSVHASWDDASISKLKEKTLWIRQQVLRMACEANGGHIAPAFSCTEILVALYYGGILKIDPDNPKWPERDRFILSKAQAALALYPILGDLGFFPMEEVYTFTKTGSRLGGHADDAVPGVDTFSGSLGHGLPIGCGMALALHLDGKVQRVFVLLGDGECHEGSVWEAAMFAGHNRLSNMVAIVDNNGLSASDHLDNYLSLEPFEQKWISFGWDVVTVNGHSLPQLLKALQRSPADGQRPLAVIAKTVKGKGVSFIEDQADWHYRIPVDDELTQARKELGLTN